MSDRVLLGIADELLAECIKRLLSEHYQVFLPQRSDQLVREAVQIKAQLLILDDSLEEDPSSLCLALTRRAPRCRLLYLSTNWQPSLAAQLQTHGVSTLLHKPFSTDKLLSCTQRLLDATPC